ncbi:Uncharacterised protein [Vibrio cholerae]|nr:Uncharacterised protein [Vibrio cholerae]
MLCCPTRNRGEFLVFGDAQFFDQIAGIDADGATFSAQSSRGAGI